SLAFTPEARVGDYVLIHAGFAISVLDENSARESLALLEEMEAGIAAKREAGS
ncbi:MAG: HypC/HybG/HupF family hydrogenase formation chaperone, partial [Chromatiaceae bacterium]